MIVTRNLLSEFVDISKISHDELYAKFNSIGLEVDRFFKLSIPENIVVGEITECQKHPSADKLSICSVKVGKNIEKSIVCGAANVKDAKFVAVALEGAKLPDGTVIKKAELRGVESHGMICSSEELGLPKINDGIMILDESIGVLKAGEPLSKNGFFNDDVYEIDLTPNRGDCLSVFGIAREVAASFSLSLKKLEFKKDEENTLGIGRFFQVTHEGHTYSNLLYKAIEFDELRLPLKIAFYLSLNESVKKSNIENYLEYASYLSGTIFNPYRNSIFGEAKEGGKKPTLLIKKDDKGMDSVYYTEKLSTVGVNLFDEARPTDTDKKVILEASYADPETISKLTYQTKVKKDKDIFYRSSRGSNPDLGFGMNILCELLRTYSSATIYSGTHELSQTPHQKTISLSLKKISALIGQDIEEAKVISILKNLFFEVESVIDDDMVVIKIPQFRHDVSGYQDVIEEIVRLVGVDNIKPKPLIFSEWNRQGSGYAEYKKTNLIRQKAITKGFCETLHFLFSSRKLQEELKLPCVAQKDDLANPITGELDTLRSTLLVGILESASKNIKNGKKSFGLFEIGSVFDANRDEGKKIAFLFCGSSEDAYFVNGGKPKQMDFFEFSDAVSAVIGDFELREPDFSYPLLHPYASAALFRQKEHIGAIGKLHPAVQKMFDLPETFVCELDFDLLTQEPKIVKEYSKFQQLDRDISVVISKSIPFAAIRNLLESLEIKEIVRVVPFDIYAPPELGEKISLTIRLYIQPINKSLEDDEINGIMEKCICVLKNEFNAELR